MCPVPPHGWGQAKYLVRLNLLKEYVLSLGRRMMVSLSTYQACFLQRLCTPLRVGHQIVHIEQVVRVCGSLLCEVCSRSFRREGDKRRHKCVAEREKPVSSIGQPSTCV